MELSKQIASGLALSLGLDALNQVLTWFWGNSNSLGYLALLNNSVKVGWGVIY